MIGGGATTVVLLMTVVLRVVFIVLFLAIGYSLLCTLYNLYKTHHIGIPILGVRGWRLEDSGVACCNCRTL